MFKGIREAIQELWETRNSFPFFLVLAFCTCILLMIPNIILLAVIGVVALVLGVPSIFWVIYIPAFVTIMTITAVFFSLMRFYWRKSKVKHPSLTKPS